MLTSQDVQTVLELSKHWIEVLQTGESGWMEQHLSDDFRFTTRLVPGMCLHKAKFIEAMKGIAQPRVEIISLAGEVAGKIIVTRSVLKIDAQVTADPGPGMPSAAEISAQLTGHSRAYCSGWRRSGKLLQCFDHHQIGQTD